MAKAVEDSFLDLEKHRQLLEENIEKLRKSLLHWHTWEVEYEWLKEEILAGGPEPSHERLWAIGREFEGKLITQAEVDDILGVKITRSTDQVTNILSRRIEYVSQNINTLAKQLETAENKLAAATVISNPEVRTEEGLPMIEIIEELDEDGNVISSRTETQGSAQGQLLEVLEKAGLTNAPGAKIQSNFEKISSQNGTSEGNGYAEVSLNSSVPEIPKKSVQFVDGTKEASESPKSQTAQRIKALTDAIKRNNSMPEEVFLTPVNESAADAALRKEMLQYGMSEVGAVVAELDVEDGSEVTDEEDFDDYDASSTEDDEDEFGRSTRKVVDDELHQQMVELEQKLGLRVVKNAGILLNRNDLSEHLLESPEGTVAFRNLRAKREKKDVRFAEELDIAEDASVNSKAKSKPVIPSMSPLRDVVKHLPSTEAQEPVSIQKVSRLDSDRTSNSPGQLPEMIPPSSNSATPTKIVSRPIADTIIERQIPEITPLEPDELDPILLHQEAAIEYHRMRNRMIQKQGGFMKDPKLEDGITPLSEEEGGPKKLSRFKAARLARG